MSIWAEVRCDFIKPGCYSGLNKGPMGWIGSKHPGRDRFKLLESAAKAGWQRKRYGLLACPVCAKGEK